MDVLSNLNDIYTESEVDTLLSGKADTSHNHDNRYYTETEIDAQMGGKANTSHSHDDLYYTETEIDSLLSGKADTSHSHDQFVPKGGIIFYHSGISGASYPSGTFARCDGTGGTPDLDDKFLLPSSTAGSTGGSSTHTHTPSFSSVNVTPCGGGGTDAAQVDITLGSTNHLPPYYTLITLARIA